MRKEQHNKARAANGGEGDPEAPLLDELVPDKLARPDDPLAKAVEFLRPLQQLAKDCIRTHLLAFEIYARKNKLLLMLQSIKRAQKIDAGNAQLHACIIRFVRALDRQAADIVPAVRAVIDKQLGELLGGKSALELNAEVLRERAQSAQHVLQAAHQLYELDAQRRDEAVALCTRVEQFARMTLEVNIYEERYNVTLYLIRLNISGSHGH